MKVSGDWIPSRFVRELQLSGNRSKYTMPFFFLFWSLMLFFTVLFKTIVILLLRTNR